MSFAIKADNISRSFKVKKKIISALKSINIDAKQGEITMLVGPDGAGKTTFLRMCAGLLTPDAGTLEILGLNAVKTPYLIQSQVSYMPQRFGLYEDLTVAENLDLYADLYGISGDDRQK